MSKIASESVSQPRAICTIIAKNYLAFARTLAQSFQTHHPNDKCFVLIVDDFANYIDPAREQFEIIKLEDLEIPDVRNFCFKYDLKELCTAVKARLLEDLITAKGIDRLFYLDPDILVTAPLDELFEKLGGHDIVLTPHLDRDYPNDGRLPDVGHILRAGVFNLGFIGINSSANARSFLDWWRPKLDEKCLNDVEHGYFVDQKYIDLVPLLFPNVLIETGVGYNAAYWNLHSRFVSHNGTGWRCNDSPLYFFHFSGYSPERATISSHIPNHLARYRLSNRRDLRKLFREYKRLLRKNDYDSTIDWPYSFGYFDTGEPISRANRAFYRTAGKRAQRFGDPFASTNLKRMFGIDAGSKRNGQARNGVYLTSDEQLKAILNSRAWRWVNRYGRFKIRYVTPAWEFAVGRLRPATSSATSSATIPATKVRTRRAPSLNIKPSPHSDVALPLPPHDLRVQVGRTDDQSFDNPTGGLVFADVPESAYESVFDWGCGCGRLARQLIQQRPQPRKYLGVDLNERAISWCRENLAPCAPQFEFQHQNVHNIGLNPSGTVEVLPFPLADGSVSLFFAWSVFTHTIEDHVQFYLSEVARVLRPEGIAITSWMLFDKQSFPMMKDSQNAFYINARDPTNAVIYDRQWLARTFEETGLVISAMGELEPDGARRIDLRLRK